LKINEVILGDLLISVLFSNGENRKLDFKHILSKDWKVTKKDREYKLNTPEVFTSVELIHGTLAWKAIPFMLTDEFGAERNVPFDVGADVLYDLSIPDESRSHAIGKMFKQWRVEAKLTQEEVARRSGTSRTYITKIENGSQDIELDTLYRIVEGGLNKTLVLSVM
jgi:DNA-binding XRE family transcriptional regulator